MSERSTQYHDPPRSATRILGFLLKDPVHETPLGDFEEFYNWIAEEKGSFPASLWYWAQVLILLRKKTSYSIHRSIEMFKSYIKTAVRNMLRHKVFSFINIFGLSIGISVCLIIFNYVRDEFTFDNFHGNTDRIYRLIREISRPNRPVRITSSVACPTKDLFERTYPEVKYVSRLIEESVILKHNNDFFEQKMFYADPEFLKMFSFNIVAGDRENPLGDLNAVILSESIAGKFYPGENPIGISAFILSGAITLLLAVMTISFHSLKAALSNPAKSLRTE
ncbi:ABC transporter permease [candidate division KSB1 bacterium]